MDLYLPISKKYTARFLYLHRNIIFVVVMLTLFLSEIISKRNYLSCIYISKNFAYCRHQEGYRTVRMNEHYFLKANAIFTKNRKGSSASQTIDLLHVLKKKFNACYLLYLVTIIFDDIRYHYITS